MSIRVAVGFLMAALLLSPPAAVGQRPAEIAFADPQPHFVAAWAPKKPREAERSAVLVRRLSLELVDVTLDSALKELTAQAGLNITYSPAVLPAGKRVTIKATDIAVVTALTEILFRSGLDVMVDRDGTLALVVCRHPAPRAEIFDSGSIVGTVTDKATGAPISGATVTVESTRSTATTASDGTYRIDGVEPGTYTVRARYIGYAPLAVEVVVPKGGEVKVELALSKSTQKLDELVTTGTLVPTELKAVPTPVSVITAEDIALQRPQTLAALFRQAIPSGVSWEFAAFPWQTSFSVRGASSLSGSGKMKVLIDGVETADPIFSAVDPTSIERVEVIRGPQAATIYGSEAIGGVVQIFTKRGAAAEQVEAQVALGVVQTPYDNHGAVLRQTYSAGVRGGNVGFGYNFGGGYSRTSNYLPSDEVSVQSNPSVYGGVRVTRGIITADLSARYYVNNTPQVFNPAMFQTGFLPFSKPNYQSLQVQNQSTSVKFSIAPASWWHNTVTLGLDREIRDMEQYRPRRTTPEDTLLLVVNEVGTKTSVGYTTSVHGQVSSALSASVTAGVDHWSQPFRQWLTAGALQTTGSIRTAGGQSIGATRYTTSNTGYFAQVQLGLRDALFLTGGLRAEENSDFGEDLGAPVAPRVGLSYVPQLSATTLKVRAAYGQAIRAPLPQQKFTLQTPTNIIVANTLLGPERQRGWDAGVDVVFGRKGTLSLSYYDQKADDLIQLVLLGTDPVPTSQYQNVAQVRNKGLEVDGTISLGSFQMKGQYAYSRARVERLAAGNAGDLRLGDQAFLVPKHTAGASLTVAPRRSTSIALGITYVGSWKERDWLVLFACAAGTGPCRPTSRDYYIDYPGYAKLSATVWQQLTPGMSAFISIDNIANYYAYEFWNFNTVRGRTTMAGMRFEH